MHRPHRPDNLGLTPQKQMSASGYEGAVLYATSKRVPFLFLFLFLLIETKW
jgi:hypothetical protein